MSAQKAKEHFQKCCKEHLENDNIDFEEEDCIVEMHCTECDSVYITTYRLVQCVDFDGNVVYENT